MRDWVRAAFPLAGEAPWTARAGAAWLALWVVVAVVSPLLGHPVGADVDVSRANLGPGPEAWLGTDHLGRDILGRLLLASRAFVFPGLLACAVAGLGAPLGLLAAGAPRRLGPLARGLVGSIAGIPTFVAVLLLLGVLGNRAPVLALGIGLAGLPELFEGVRSRAEELVHTDYVGAARLHGLSSTRLFLLHLGVGACGALVARHLLRVFGAMVVMESTLAYLGGLGVQEPWPSWGNMVAFEWGRGLSWAPPAVALLLTLWAVSAAGRLFQEAPRVP